MGWSLIGWVNLQWVLFRYEFMLNVTYMYTVDYFVYFCNSFVNEILFKTLQRLLSKEPTVVRLLICSICSLFLKNKCFLRFDLKCPRLLKHNLYWLSQYFGKFWLRGGSRNMINWLRFNMMNTSTVCRPLCSKRNSCLYIFIPGPCNSPMYFLKLFTRKYYCEYCVFTALNFHLTFP